MTDKEIIEQQRTMIAMLQESYQQLKNKDSNGFDRNITFRDCAEAYLKYLKRNSKASSYDNVKWMFDKVILNELGGILIADMKRSTIQSLADKLAEHYSPHTVQDFIALIKTTLKYASKNEMIPSVTYSIDLPKKERQNYRVLTKKEFNKLRVLLIDDETPKSTAILLMLETGIRIGEACALQWKDVDFKKRTVSITKTVYRTNDGIQTGVPKTENSVRKIPMSETLYEALRERREDQTPETYIATGQEYSTEPRTLRAAYTRRLKKWGFDYLKPHELRHSFATRAIESGVDPKTVAALLGHKSCNITLDIYTSATDKMLRAGIKKMS